MQNRKKLIYVYGLGRSGSTLLGQVLGQSLESRCVGEFVRFASKKDLSRPENPQAVDVRDIPCGCGKRGAECTQNALAKYLPEIDLLQVEHFFSLSNLTFPSKEQTADFFVSVRGIYDTYPETIIIDTSKNARILFFLRQSKAFEDWDIQGVFVYRKLSEVWKSWRSKKGYLLKKAPSEIFKNIIGGLFWSFIVYCLHIRKDLFVKYSDLRNNPTKEINRLNNSLGLAISISQRQVKVVNESHEVAGNPSKLEHQNSIIIR